MNKLIVTAILITACHAFTFAQTVESTSVETDTQTVSGLEKTNAETLNDKLIACVKSGDADCVVQALAEGADVNADDEDDGLVLNLALIQGDKLIVRALLERGANISQHEKETGDTPLMMAAKRGDVFWTRELISRSAEIDAEDDGGHTALWATTAAVMAANSPQLANVMFSEEGKEEVKFGTEDDYIKIINLLLDSGADPNHVAHDCGMTPLFCIAMSGNIVIAKLLLERGATADEQNSMWREIFASEKEFAKSLKEDGANPDESRAMLEWFKATKGNRKQIKKLIEDAKLKR